LKTHRERVGAVGSVAEMEGERVGAMGRTEAVVLQFTCFYTPQLQLYQVYQLLITLQTPDDNTKFQRLRVTKKEQER